MKTNKYSKAPLDAKDRMNIEPIVCYPIDDLKETNLPILHNARKNLKSISETIFNLHGIFYFLVIYRLVSSS